jgi:hypothetical protein
MPKTPRCKICDSEFQKYKSTDTCCSHSCQTIYNRQKAEAKEAKEWSVTKKEMQTALMTIGDYEEDLQTEINLICRIIDSGCMCISCQNKGKFSAGHYHSRGKNKTLKFNLHNVHIQCFHCNGPLSANTTKYNLGLIQWYGKEYQEYVEYKIPLEFKSIKWTKNDLILWKAQAVTYKKELLKQELYEVRSPEERLYLRTYYNEKLGIYNSKLNRNEDTIHT